MHATPIPTLTLTSALKEWAVAVTALTEGKTILLLRKGGIREQGNLFTVPQQRFWLYPTYEHQKPHLLKPEYANQVEPVSSGWHPSTVEIQAWAEITQSFQINDAAVIEALFPFHIWNSQFVLERLNWKPHAPLAVLLLRVYKLPQIQCIPYLNQYGGCKSWIELQADLSPAAAPVLTPVLTAKEYFNQVHAIERIIG